MWLIELSYLNRRKHLSCNSLSIPALIPKLWPRVLSAGLLNIIVNIRNIFIIFSLIAYIIVNWFIPVIKSILISMILLLILPSINIQILKILVHIIILLIRSILLIWNVFLNGWLRQWSFILTKMLIFLMLRLKGI